MRTKSIIAGVLLVGSLLMMASLAMAQKVKSKAEGEAVNAVIGAQTPDQKLDAVDKLLAKYKDTEFKSLAMTQAGEAYEQKGDSVNAIIWGQRGIDADPKNYNAMLLVSRQLVRTTGENDLDKDEKIKRGNKLADDAIAAVSTASKPNPNLAEERWTAFKKDSISEAHETKGSFANVDKKYDVAIAEYKLAIDGAATPQATTYIRLASVYNNSGKFDEASLAADQALAVPGTPDAVKKFAQNERDRAQKGKASKK
jgi:tetratricopeptide (TPR) repeat protein